jgi:hypothetical protein
LDGVSSFWGESSRIAEETVAKEKIPERSQITRLIEKLQNELHVAIGILDGRTTLKGRTQLASRFPPQLRVYKHP